MRSIALLLVVPALAVGYLLGVTLGPGASARDAARTAEWRTGSGAPAPGGPGAHVATPPASTAEPAERAPHPERRTSVAGSAPVAAAPEPAVPSAPALGALLRQWLDSGALEHELSTRPDEVAELLVRQFIAADDPWSAAAVLRAHPLDADRLGMVGQALAAKGDVGLASELLLEAVRSSSIESAWADVLVQVDPLGGLHAFEDALAADPALAAMLEPRIVQVLAAAGRREEALRRLDALLEAEWVDPALWDQLVQLDPEGAEERLRAVAGDDPYGHARTRLAHLLASSGRTEEAVELLRDLLADEATSREALEQIGALAPEEGLSLLRERLAAAPGEAATWSLYGAQLAELGRSEEATDAWLRAFELNPDDGSWTWQLLEHAPERAWPLLEERARVTRDDELWGDLADSYWRAGRYGEARAAWKTARRIDPDDGEWTGKLHDVAAGTDPLGLGDEIEHHHMLEPLGY